MSTSLPTSLKIDKDDKEKDEIVYEIPVKVERRRSSTLIKNRHSLHENREKIQDSSSVIITGTAAAFITSNTASNTTNTTSVRNIDEHDLDKQEDIKIDNIICPAVHEGRHLLNLTLPINVEKVMDLIFRTNTFMREFHEFRKNMNLVHGPWSTNEDGHKCRTVNVSVFLNQTVGPKYSAVTEKHTNSISIPGKHYTVNILASNAGIPYADTFEISTHHCLMAQSASETLYQVFMQIKFKKSVWAVVKGLIEKNVFSGSDSYYEALTKRLQNECITNTTETIVKSKTKRTRKVAIGKTTKLLQYKQIAEDELDDIHEEIPYNQENLIMSTDQIPSTSAQSPQSPSSSLSPLKKRSITKIKHLPIKDIEQKPNYMILFLLSIPILLLIVINVLLYIKLNLLENEQRYHITEFKIMRMLPKSQEEWLKLLQTQEDLHANEMNKWYSFLKMAVDLLQKSEKSLNDLLNLLRPYNKN